VAEVGLGAFDTPLAEHKKAANALETIQYKNVVSVEMRNAGIEKLVQALNFVQSQYKNVVQKEKKIAVIGGGWYGCHLASSLIQDGHEVVVFERRDKLFSEASSNNQFRLHLGFHYPRSFKTRDQMQSQFFRFRNQYPALIESVGWNFYAIAEGESLVDFGTYVASMKSMGLSFQVLDPSLYGVKNVEGMVSCREMVFKKDEPEKLFSKKLEGHLNLSCNIEPGDIKVLENGATVKGEFFQWVLNCSYNHLIIENFQSPLKCFYELCLLLLYEDLETEKPPIALTIMDGNLCSLYPVNSSAYPKSQRMVSLSSVAFTPLGTFETVEDLYQFEKDLDLNSVAAGKKPLFEKEINHFFPSFAKRYRYTSFYTAYKTKPVENSANRECFVNSQGPIVNIWSGKINSMYSAQQRVGDIIGIPSKQYLGENVALLGYTGFVGSTLNSQAQFHHLFNSKNVSKIRGQSYNMVVCAGAPAVKWKANKFPEEDTRAIDTLIENLDQMKDVGLMVLISTIDVYPVRSMHAEDFVCDLKENHTYGANRLRLENFVLRRFPKCLIVRLPALFGKGLKKNYIYDFIHNNNIGSIDPSTKFQWYGVENLMNDITMVLARNEQLAEPIQVVNFFPEPIHTSDIIDQLFKQQSPFTKKRSNTLNGLYDLRTLHGEIFSSPVSGYMRSAAEIMKALTLFVKSESK
jgi:nucleoside-diphosphate-sugar epimerase